VKIVLTVAHLNHDITDNRPENLRALCQRCHLTHDKEQHAQTRRRNRYSQTPDLFTAQK
jgi:5-methylcytosine-specific restriction endonuclease McrA